MKKDPSDLKFAERKARDSIIDRFGTFENWYLQNGHKHLNDLELLFVKKLIRLSGREIVLDAGCATGRFSQLAAKHARGVISLDHSLHSLKALRSLIAREPRSQTIRPLHADIAFPVLRAGTVDRIIAVGVLQHVPSERERTRAVQGFSEVLSPGGRILLSVYRWSPGETRDDVYPDGICFHRFDAAELRKLLADAGFSNIHIYPMSLTFYSRLLTLKLSTFGWIGTRMDYLLSHFLRPEKHGAYLFLTASKLA